MFSIVFQSQTIRRMQTDRFISRIMVIVNTQFGKNRRNVKCQFGTVICTKKLCLEEERVLTGRKGNTSRARFPWRPPWARRSARLPGVEAETSR